MANVRTMQMGDYDAVIALWQATPRVGLSEVDSREGIASYLERNRGMSFVAYEGDALVGAVLCGHDGRRGYLHHLAVAPAYRGQGIGRVLVEHCMGALAAQSITKCHIFVFGGNGDGQAFWEHVGWQRRRDLEIMSRSVGGAGGGESPTMGRSHGSKGAMEWCQTLLGGPSPP